MKAKISKTVLLFIFCWQMQAQIPKIYFLTGQGADERLFKNLNLPDSVDVRHVKYFTPAKGTDMQTYARQLSAQIDTAEAFVLVGVSLGGMLAVEMSQMLHPQKTIIISSAKNRNELPERYTFQRKFKLYGIVFPGLMKAGSRLLQPLVEPDRKREKETFRAMLKAKDPLFLKRTVAMLINWQRTESPPEIIHIHGDNDHTIPIKNVDFDLKIENGSHLMTLTRGAEIGEILQEIIRNLPTQDPLPH